MSKYNFNKLVFARNKVHDKLLTSISECNQYKKQKYTKKFNRLSALIENEISNI